jgi:dCTP deaminase
MTVLSNGSIKRLIELDKLVENYASMKDQLQPASFDFRLGESMKIAGYAHMALDPFDRSSLENSMAELPLIKDANGDAYWLIEPYDFCLAYTMEKVNIPTHVGCQVSGRSSIGRLGLFIHITAGWVDPGFSGHVTLEIYNANPRPLILRPAMKIGQFIFQYLDVESTCPYSGRYQNQSASPEISRFVQ